MIAIHRYCIRWYSVEHTNIFEYVSPTIKNQVMLGVVGTVFVYSWPVARDYTLIFVCLHTVTIKGASYLLS